MDNNPPTKRNTLQRQVIYDAVKALNIHATAEQVLDRLSYTHPGIGRATVYRNLSSMSQSGELLKITSFDGATHYDHQCHPHYHFECSKCKKIFDVEGDVTHITQAIGPTHGFDITHCNISFSGLCWQCK